MRTPLTWLRGLAGRIIWPQLIVGTTLVALITYVIDSTALDNR